MGKLANKFTNEEIEILTLVFRDYLLEQEIMYPSGVPKNYYKVLNRLVKMRGIKNESKR